MAGGFCSAADVAGEGMAGLWLAYGWAITIGDALICRRKPSAAESSSEREREGELRLKWPGRS